MERKEIESEMIVRLFQTSNALQTFLDRDLKKVDLTAKQFYMMIIIGSFKEDPKLIDIANRFKTSHQKVRQVLNKLTKAGYTSLYKDAKDSRITRVKLTNQAIDFWKTRDHDDEISMRRVFNMSSKEDLSTTLNTLINTLKSVEEMIYD